MSDVGGKARVLGPRLVRSNASWVMHMGTPCEQTGMSEKHYLPVTSLASSKRTTIEAVS